jgi:hypothetical protein
VDRGAVDRVSADEPFRSPAHDKDLSVGPDDVYAELKRRIGRIG